MGRLIDADVLLSEMEKYSDDSARSKNEYLFGMQQRLETCIKLIEDAPTVDAVPVVHGRWIDETFKAWGLVHHPYKCDQCGYHSEAPSDYCPDCGARMDGKDDDNGKTD